MELSASNGAPLGSPMGTLDGKDNGSELHFFLLGLALRTILRIDLGTLLGPDVRHSYGMLLYWELKLGFINGKEVGSELDTELNNGSELGTEPTSDDRVPLGSSVGTLDKRHNGLGLGAGKSKGVLDGRDNGFELGFSFGLALRTMIGTELGMELSPDDQYSVGVPLHWELKLGTARGKKVSSEVGIELNNGSETAPLGWPVGTSDGKDNGLELCFSLRLTIGTMLGIDLGMVLGPDDGDSD